MTTNPDPGPTGLVLRIEHASIYDGEGIRTVDFMKGCPLGCLWCSTPESQCFDVEQAEGVTYGQTRTARQIFDEVRKDELFFFHSGGGVTFSGGEPLMQSEFVADVLDRCRYLGIGTAIETSLFADWSRIEPLLPRLDLIYADLKAFDAENHKRLTGVDNALILDNITRIDRAIDRSRLILRTPIVPGINDSDDELLASARFCAGLAHLRYWEWLPYHRLGIDTYRKLGREYALAHVKTPTREYLTQKAEPIRAQVPQLKLSIR